MKHKLTLTLATLAAFFGWQWWEGQKRGQPAIAVDQTAIQAYFSPRGGASRAIVDALDGAEESVFVQAYSFTSEPIAAALVRAKRRGVGVQVLLDKSQKENQKEYKQTKAPMLVRAGIPVWIDDKHSIAHNKVMIIDKKIVVTGSFNFTTSAEDRNAENLLIVKDPNLAARYLANWESHRAHSVEY
ncbi:MAG: phospholipase D family protein [Holophagales bacterium]|nr:phospholipase D family protein [Holophagales bacterium]